MWYALQITVFCYTMYVYLAEIKTQEPTGFVVIFAILAAFFATEIVSALLSGAGKLISLTRSVRVAYSKERLLTRPWKTLR
jgi:hypothetical protein